MRAALTWVRSQGPSDLLIVMKSTVPRGSGVEFLLGDLRDPDFDYGANIEFLREGWTPEDWNARYRIVLGAGPYASRANETVRRMYAGTESLFLIANITRTAMVKYASNALLAIRISLLNEMAALSDQLGASLDSVCDGPALDSRTGSQIRVGVGYGGACFPKDILAHGDAQWVSPSLIALCHTPSEARSAFNGRRI